MKTLHWQWTWMKIEEKTKILTKFVSLSVFRFLRLVITAIAFYELNFQLTANNLGSKSIIKRSISEHYQNWNEVVMQTYTIVTASALSALIICRKKTSTLCEREKFVEVISNKLCKKLIWSDLGLWSLIFMGLSRVPTEMKVKLSEKYSILWNFINTNI